MLKKIWNKTVIILKKTFNKKFLACLLAVIVTASATMGIVFAAFKLNSDKSSQSVSLSLNNIYKSDNTISVSVPEKPDDFVEGIKKAGSNGTGKYVTKDGEVVDDDLVVGGSTIPEDGSKYYSPDFVTQNGALILNGYFSDNMLFQQERPIVVWGKETSGQKVVVKLVRDSDKMVISQNSIVASDGQFYIRLPKVKGSFETYTLILEGSCHKKYNNILIGELWVAGGQDNMELPVKKMSNGRDVINAATNPHIRIFQEISTKSDSNNAFPVTPEFDVADEFLWGLGNDSNFVAEVSAIGYTFAKQLYSNLGVPVGIIDVAVSGTSIEAWLSRDVIEGTDAVYNYLSGKKRYLTEEKINGSNVSRYNQMTVQYNKRIAPIKRANVKGVIWYQGETNIADCMSDYYTDALRALTKEWSKAFGSTSKQLPFLFFNIAPYNFGTEYVSFLNEKILDLYRENTSVFSVVPVYDISLNYNTQIAMSATVPTPLTPTDKEPLGIRAAKAAMGTAYQAKYESMAPVFKKTEILGNTVKITFDHAGDGLAIKNNQPELVGFTIADGAGKFIKAQARIANYNTVEVWSDYIKSPKYVAYAFSDYNMEANLVNSIGCPALPFRSEKKMEFLYYRFKSWTVLANLSVWSLSKTSPRTDSYVTAWASAPEALSRITELKADNGQDINNKFALKISYNSSNTLPILFGVNENALNVEPQFTPYSKLTFTVYNPDARDKTFTRLNIKSDSRNFYAGSAVVIPAKTSVTISVDIWSIRDKNGNPVTEIVSMFNAIQNLNFEFADNYQGTLYIHSILFRS